jgi:saccharopine dehydrogenase-like NADP-dependent oxidoreductase
VSNQKIIVLGGAGAMGQVIVRDLCETSPAEQILVADYNLTSAQELSAKLNDKRVTVSAVDLTDRSSLIELLHDCSLVINSTPYIYNLQVM